MHQQDVPLLGDLLDNLSPSELIELAHVQARNRMIAITRGDALVPSLVPTLTYAWALIERARMSGAEGAL